MGRSDKFVSKARVLYDKAEIFSRQGHLDAAIALCDEINIRFGEDEDEGTWVADALSQKAFILGEKQGHLDAAIALYDEIDHRFGGKSSPELRWRAAEALCNKAVIFSRQDHFDATIALCPKIAFVHLKLPADG